MVGALLRGVGGEAGVVCTCICMVRRMVMLREVCNDCLQV